MPFGKKKGDDEEEEYEEDATGEVDISELDEEVDDDDEIDEQSSGNPVMAFIDNQLPFLGKLLGKFKKKDEDEFDEDEDEEYEDEESVDLEDAVADELEDEDLEEPAAEAAPPAQELTEGTDELDLSEDELNLEEDLAADEGAGLSLGDEGTGEVAVDTSQDDELSLGTGSLKLDESILEDDEPEEELEEEEDLDEDLQVQDVGEVTTMRETKYNLDEEDEGPQDLKGKILALVDKIPRNLDEIKALIGKKNVDLDDEDEDEDEIDVNEHVPIEYAKDKEDEEGGKRKFKLKPLHVIILIGVIAFVVLDEGEKKPEPEPTAVSKKKSKKKKVSKKQKPKKKEPEKEPEKDPKVAEPTPKKEPEGQIPTGDEIKVDETTMAKKPEKPVEDTVKEEDLGELFAEDDLTKPKDKEPEPVEPEEPMEPEEPVAIGVGQEQPGDEIMTPGEVVDITGGAGGISPEILKDLEKKVAQEKKKAEIQRALQPVDPPDYEDLGRGLVYNCAGKHWACIGQLSYKACSQNYNWNSSQGLPIECYPVEVYMEEVDCTRVQQLKIDSVAKTDFCNGGQ